MSFERTLDTLDEKVSSLIRTTGIIITLLFGFLALILNHLSFTIFIAILLFLTSFFFIFTIAYSIRIYAFSSFKTHDYVNMINSNYNVLRITQDFYIKIIHDLVKCISDYYNLVLNNNIKIDSIDDLKNQMIRKLEVKQADTIEYQLKMFNIGEINYYLERFKAIFKLVSVSIPSSNDELIENRLDQFKLTIKNLIENIINYFNDVINYADLRLKSKSFTYGSIIQDNIFSLFRFVLEEFRDIIDGTYRKNFLLKNTMIDKYKIKIKISYSLFSTCLFLSCFLLIIIIGSIPLAL